MKTFALPNGRCRFSPHMLETDFRRNGLNPFRITFIHEGHVGWGPVYVPGRFRGLGRWSLKPIQRCAGKWGWALRPPVVRKKNYANIYGFHKSMSIAL